jgi:predicted HicB family RNase H-like nuclease
METIKYKDFIGSVEINREGDEYIIHGKILFINDLVTYEADNLQNINAEFQAAVDDYIGTCKQLGIEPHKSYSGSFNVRIGPETHQRLARFAIQNDKKINSIVKNAVEEYLDRKNNKNREIHHHYHIVRHYSEFATDEDIVAQQPDKITYKNQA